MDAVTKLLVISIRDLDTGDIIGTWNPSTGFSEALEILQEAEVICGHNIIRYDNQVLLKLHGITIPVSKVIDTYVLARLVYPDIQSWDSTLHRSEFPSDLFKRHSLKAWGYRLKCFKGDYDGGFEEWSPDMEDYCVQDTMTNWVLWKHLETKGYSQEALDLEQKVQAICDEIEQNGWPFDFKKAIELQGELSALREDLRQQLIHTFGTWIEADGDVKVAKVNFHKRGIEKGSSYQNIKYVTFNPGSRQHIAKRLKFMHGWEPKVFTKNGEPKVDDEVIEALPYPEAKLLSEFLMIEKRLSQLAEGDKSWLNFYNHKTGKIHGAYNTLGTNTTRSSHFNPNIAQVPSNDKPFGERCRQLFHIPKGWVGLGTDMSGLEARCLGHYVAYFDGGAYSKVLLEDDVHWLNAQLLGFVPMGAKRDKSNDAWEKARGTAKTFLYALLYGAGDELIGAFVNGGRREGKRLKERFFTNLKALGQLDEHVKNSCKKGYLINLMGNHLPVRSDHSALNLLLQGTGAQLCKAWISAVRKRLDALGLRCGWDGDYVLLGWIHDEQQFACRTNQIARLIGTISIQEARKLTSTFNFKCPLDADFSLGLNWSETH